MDFRFAYRSASQVCDGSAVDSRRRVSLQPDLLRRPTFFVGQLADPVAFREAAGALHDVVISDRKYRPADRSAYLAWKREQLQQQSAEYWRQYRAYLDLLWQTRRAADLLPPTPWFDPVINVAADQVSFEAFSRDESAYGRLALSDDAFSSVRERSPGTTNIDFSAELYGQFQRLRSDRATWLEIDPAGFSVQQAGGSAHREKKITLPDSWVRGFLQVQSAMARPMLSFVLSPVDLYNLCTLLRRHREKAGPRALRWELRADAAVEAVLEPWEIRLRFAGSRWSGDAAGFSDDPSSASPMERRGSAVVVRTWGRRRLALLERLLPAASHVGVHLLGRGMPSFFLLYLGRMTFCLGLSGWTANDWTTAAGFDLLAGDTDVGEADRTTAELLATGLRQRLSAGSAELARELGLPDSVVAAGLRRLCREGRVMLDLDRQLYRWRELTATPLPAEHLAFRDARIGEAHRLLKLRRVALLSTRDLDGSRRELVGRAAEVQPSELTLTLDGDGRVLRGSCGCHDGRQRKLRQGPCAHLLALRLLSPAR